MARKVVLTSDLSGESPARTFEFSFDGVDFEIDMTEDEGKQYVEAFTEAALDYLRVMRERPDLHRLRLWAEMQEATDPEVHDILEQSRRPLVEVMVRLFHREGGALVMAVLRGFSGVASEMIHPAVVEQVVRSVIRATVELNVAMDAGQSTALIGVDPPVAVEDMPGAAPY